MDRKTKELKESCKCDTLSLKIINVSCHKSTIISESKRRQNNIKEVNMWKWTNKCQLAIEKLMTV